MDNTVYRTADIGYGYLKYPTDNGAVEKVKAVVALLGESLNPGELKGVDVFEVDGDAYIVGADVYKLGRKPITANENVNRADNIAYKVLALYALAKTHDPGAESITFLTGLPFQNLDESAKVSELFEREHTVKLNGRAIKLNVSKTVVMSQGLGSFYSLVRQRGYAALTKKILLVDLGFRTINYIPINNGDIDINAVKTNRDLGIQDAYKRIADAVNIEFKTNYKFYDVDDLLDTGVPTQDIEKGKTYTNIVERDYVVDALSSYARDVWTDFADKYGDSYREELEEVVFSGGTAERVQAHLLAARKHYCTFVEDAQDVQVLGYAEVAQKIDKQQRQEVRK